jgi:hypothetical protein
MPSIQMRTGLAARQVDSDLSAAQGRYPRYLPLTRFSVLLGWEPKLKPVGGMLAGYTPEKFERLSLLPRQLEINRAHAESLLRFWGQSPCGDSPHCPRRSGSG